MIRTQVYLPEQTHRELQELARTSESSFSQLIREGADLVVQERKAKQRKKIPKLVLPTFSVGTQGAKRIKKLDRRAIYEDF